MIYKMGKVVSRGKNYLILESNFTGYIIQIALIERFEIDKFQKIYLFKYKNEYTETLYGFKSFKEKIFFEDLLSVQGIGPKTAMVLLENGWKEVAQLIAEGNWQEISKFQYIGLKSAKQLVFEFQNKYEKMTNNIDYDSKIKKEVRENLKILGFNDKHIDSALKNIKENNDIEKMIEEAIRMISNEQRNKTTTIIET